MKLAILLLSIVMDYSLWSGGPDREVIKQAATDYGAFQMR